MEGEGSDSEAKIIDDNDDSHKWNEFNELDEGDAAYYVPDSLPIAKRDTFAALTLKAIKAMKGPAIRDLYHGTGIDISRLKKIKDLRNALWSNAGVCALRKQDEAKALEGPITKEERLELAELRAERAKRMREGPELIAVVPRKRPTLITDVAARRVLVGEAATDGTFTLFEQPKHPLRALLFDVGAIGYAAGLEPPNVKTIMDELPHRCRFFAVTPSTETANKVANFKWSELDIELCAQRGLLDVKTDRKAYEMALGNFALLVGFIHGNSLAKRCRTFVDEVKGKTGEHWTMDILIPHVTLCLRHFTADLLIEYDDWLNRPSHASMELVLPVIGRSKVPEANQEMNEKLDESRYAALKHLLIAAAPPGRGSLGTAGTKPRRGINAAKVPKDPKSGLALCVALAEPGGCRQGPRCRYSHARVMSKSEYDGVFTAG